MSASARAVSDQLQDLPFTTLQSVILTTGPLIFLWSYIRKYTDSAGGFRWAGVLAKNHDILLATFSLILAAHVLDIGHDVLSSGTAFKVDPYTIGYVYHLLKLYEYTDIILMVLAGQRVSKYFAFRHLVMPFLSWYRIIGRPHHSLDWRLHAILDSSARFSIKIIPWLAHSIGTEQALVSVCEEGRWYGDLAINAFWLFLNLTGQRGTEKAIEIYGPLYADEGTARMISLGICIYAIHLKRQEDAENPKPFKIPEVGGSSTTRSSSATASGATTGPANAKSRWSR